MVPKTGGALNFNPQCPTAGYEGGKTAQVTREMRRCNINILGLSKSTVEKDKEGRTLAKEEDQLKRWAEGDTQ